jgi:deoxyhypusine synthase
MKPIHKLNGGIGATLCHLCSVIITTGNTQDLYCDKCLSERVITDSEFKQIKERANNLMRLKNGFKDKQFYEQMDKEVHKNRSDLNK